MINLSKFVAQQQNTVAATLTDFVAEAQKQNFTLVKPKGEKSVVFASKAGNPQMLFIDKEGKRIYMRISAKLDAALSAGEKIELAKSPVYEVALDNGGNMLVLGLAAEAQDFEAVDLSKAFSGAYSVA